MDKVMEVVFAAFVVAGLLVLGYSVGARSSIADQIPVGQGCPVGYGPVVDFDLEAGTGSAWCEPLFGAGEECY